MKQRMKYPERFLLYRVIEFILSKEYNLRFVLYVQLSVIVTSRNGFC